VSEYEECICKAAFLDHPAPDFELLESILWTGKDYWLLEEHMERVGDAAEYFGYAINADDIRNELESIARTLPDTPQKIRLLVGGDGTFRVTIEPVPASEPVILGIAADPINSNDPFLYHKTTHRRVYEQVVAGQPDCDDVILWNERGELTETTRANLLLKIDEKWLTPPVECGLLAGTLRRHLLEQGEIQEAVLRKKDLIRAEALEIVNSVRGRVPATVKNGADAPETA
jgi:para-aminobenzoate synthetase/4-amino-4-deoxychorismate lyase